MLIGIIGSREGAPSVVKVTNPVYPSYCYVTIVHFFQNGGRFEKARVQFNYEHLASIIIIF